MEATRCVWFSFPPLTMGPPSEEERSSVAPLYRMFRSSKNMDPGRAKQPFGFFTYSPSLNSRHKSDWFITVRRWCLHFQYKSALEGMTSLHRLFRLARLDASYISVSRLGENGWMALSASGSSPSPPHLWLTSRFSFFGLSAAWHRKRSSNA